MKKGFRKGFTLIELLIVLAVIAALLAVVTPIALNAVRRANLTEIASNLRNIKTAAETYILMEEDALSDGINVDKLYKSGYLTTDPNEGKESDPYSIELTEDPSSKNITVTIEYTGPDVSSQEDINKLHEIYSEVSTDTTNPQVVFTIKNW